MLLKALNKFRGLDTRHHFVLLLQDLLQAGFNIKQFVGDNPKRAMARCARIHSARFACEYCKAEGTKLFGMVWPASSLEAEERTIASIRAIVARLSAGETLTPYEAQGIVGESVFAMLQDFDLILDIPAEYLHSVCIGLVKKLVELTFKVALARPRKTKRKLTPPAEFNKHVRDIKVPREFSRRIRNLDFAVMKGQEFRNICLCLLYTSPSPRDGLLSRMPSSA